MSYVGCVGFNVRLNYEILGQHFHDVLTKGHGLVPVPTWVYVAALSGFVPVFTMYAAGFGRLRGRMEARCPWPQCDDSGARRPIRSDGWWI